MCIRDRNHFEDHCIWDYSVKYKNNYTYETSDGASGSSTLIFKFPKKENYPLHKFPEGEISELTGRGVLIQSAEGKKKRRSHRVYCLYESVALR